MSGNKALNNNMAALLTFYLSFVLVAAANELLQIGT
jgi:hypothetical protein